MKTLYKIFKTQLLLAVVLFGANMSFAQIVQVPPGCTVVFAGTVPSGTPAGFVGNGGIVGMPDPSGGGSFTFTAPLGAVLNPLLPTWTLKGDLSNLTTANASPANGLSANIYTFNKLVRPSESTAPSSATWARSKGRVIVGYTVVVSGVITCGNALSFDVFKVYPGSVQLTSNIAIQPINIPKIVGPACIVANQPVTYSVDQVASDNAGDAIGFDSYYWSDFPTNYVLGSLYYSADNSSITFTPTTSVGFRIKCCLGKLNANVIPSGPGPNPVTLPATTYNACVSKEVGAVPVAPSVNVVTVPVGTLTGLALSPGTNCLPTGATSLTATVQLPPGGYAYTWSCTNTTWSLTPSGAQNQTLTIGNFDNNPGTLTLKVTNGSCDPALFTYVINRTLAPALGITGLLGVPATTCISGVTSFSLPQNALGNLTNWTIDNFPTGGALPTGAPTVANGIGSGSTCAVTTGTAAGQFTLVATAKATTSCTATNTSIVINVKAPKPVFTASLPTCVPLSSPVALTSIAVTPITGATSYTWTLPPGWTCSGNCTTANPSLFPPLNTSLVGGATLAPASISVVANVGTSCPSDAGSTDPINYIRLTTNTLQTTCDQYSVNTATPCLATGTPVATFKVGGITAVSNGTTVNIFGNTLTLCGNTAPLPQGVCATVVVGGVTYTTCSSTVATGSHGLRQANTNSSIIKEVIEGVTIAPNPSTGNFAITIENIKEDSAQAILFDFNGKEIATHTLHQGENKIQKEGMPKGTYLVVLKIDGKQEARQLIIK
jgi:hypothetical protein